MLNLLIVEDNDLEREFLKNYIDWDLLGIRVVDTAYNGQDGIEKTKASKPDIILSDIKMPVMDGIAMAKAVKSLYPSIRFIFQSGYEDVALLKEAIELQAHDYILKPLNPDELIKTVKRAAAALIDEKLASLETSKIKGQYLENLPLLKDKFLENLILKERDQSEEILLYNQAGSLKFRIPGQYRLALLHLDFSNTDIFGISLKTDEIVRGLKIQCENENVEIFKFEQNKIVFLMHSLSDDGDKDGVLIKSVRAEAEVLKDQYNFQYIIGLSAKASKLTEIYGLFKQCWLATDKKTETGYGRIIQFEDSAAEQGAVKDSGKDQIKEAVKKISGRIVAGEAEEDWGNELVKMLSSIANLRLDGYQSAFLGLFASLSEVIENLGEGFEKITEDKLEIFNHIINIRTIPDLILYSNKMLNSFVTTFEKRKINKDDHVVNEILTILNKEYDRPITLTYLSDRVYLSPNYLRVLFKEKMNISIQDYLTDIRISRAKELLKDNRHKIHEIGKMVGYGNDTYFNIVFKNHVNLTPGEYRSKHLFSAVKI